jgi:hypothetical protein
MILPRGFRQSLATSFSFRNRIASIGTNFIGTPVTISSALYENSVDLGFTWSLIEGEAWLNF